MDVSKGEGPREGIRYLTSGTFGHQPFGDTLEGRLEHPCNPEQHVNVRQSERFLVLAEDSSYGGPLPDGTASVEAGVALVRGIFGYGGVQAMVGAIQRAAELESRQNSPRTVLADLGLGLSLCYRGYTSRARKPLEEGLTLTSVDQPVMRIAMLSALSYVAGDEGQLEEAESLAREARAERW